MINRVKLPKEDEFLEIANGDRDELYKNPQKREPCVCICACGTITYYSLSFLGIWNVTRL